MATASGRASVRSTLAARDDRCSIGRERPDHHRLGRCQPGGTALASTRSATPVPAPKGSWRRRNGDRAIVCRACRLQLR